MVTTLFFCDDDVIFIKAPGSVLLLKILCLYPKQVSIKSVILKFFSELYENEILLK